MWHHFDKAELHIHQFLPGNKSHHSLVGICICVRCQHFDRCPHSGTRPAPIHLNSEENCLTLPHKQFLHLYMFLYCLVQLFTRGGWQNFSQKNMHRQYSFYTIIGNAQYINTILHPDNYSRKNISFITGLHSEQPHTKNSWDRWHYITHYSIITHPSFQQLFHMTH